MQVGLEPVTVRARTDSEAWVVNHISDSVSIVDLDAMHVVATIYPGDEPCDVVFAGQPELAFVSVSQENRVLVFDPTNLDSPRSRSRSPAKTRVPSPPTARPSTQPSSSPATSPR